jgi:hypothetical protein
VPAIVLSEHVFAGEDALERAAEHMRSEPLDHPTVRVS